MLVTTKVLEIWEGKEMAHFKDLFETVCDDDSSYKILADKRTRVMYLVVRGGSATVMINPDGTPRIYEPPVDEKIAKIFD